ncbi:hypothetical protein L21SP2_0580 [Salinispira pacifica]|uniref:DUF2023 domain-containing protein n=2 Tax=Salinispira pacifica TaxID=1307761 RepID=V5WEQ4_9SPIO|nr:hypothetical protein L21SP2_0580 [Salinispira pacifica]
MSADLQICNHHLYELKKGLRDMVLVTIPRVHSERFCARLDQKDIRYFVQDVSDRKVNIFFGRSECITIVESFGVKHLHELTPEQDFILGIMLGYNSINQYERFLQRKNAREK